MDEVNDLSVVDDLGNSWSLMTLQLLLLFIVIIVCHASGEGPIHLVGIHCVEELDLGEADEGEEEEEAEDVAEKEAEELVKDSANQTPIKEKLLVTDTEVEKDSAKKASSEKIVKEDSTKKASSEKFVEEASANGAGDGKLERKDSGDKKRKASQEQGEGSQGEKKVKESPVM